MTRKPPTRSQGVQTARKLKNLLLKKGFPVRQVFLFGSVACGRTHAWSDIDIAVVYCPFADSRYDEKLSMCRAEHGEDIRNIEVVYFHQEDMEDKYSTIVQEVKKHGIPV